MIGRKAQDTVTVKDIPAHDFIVAYANYLKKANKITLPKVVIYDQERRHHQDRSLEGNRSSRS
jgi:ribosomal protein S19E (S16A)